MLAKRPLNAPTRLHPHPPYPLCPTFYPSHTIVRAQHPDLQDRQLRSLAGCPLKVYLHFAANVIQKRRTKTLPNQPFDGVGIIVDALVCFRTRHLWLAFQLLYGVRFMLIESGSLAIGVCTSCVAEVVGL